MEHIEELIRRQRRVQIGIELAWPAAANRFDKKVFDAQPIPAAWLKAHQAMSEAIDALQLWRDLRMRKREHSARVRDNVEGVPWDTSTT